MKYMSIFLVFMLTIGCSDAKSETNRYNCYAVSYVEEFKTFMTIPITEKMTKQDSERFIEKIIEDSIKDGSKSQSVKTVKVSNNSTETTGSGVIRYFCFPIEVDNNKNDKTISNFINSLNGDMQQEKMNFLFPLN